MHNKPFQLSRFIALLAILVVSLNAYGFKQSSKDSATLSTSIDLDLTSDELRWLAQHKVIRVGVKQSWKPIEFVTDQKKFRGITMDYLNRLEPILGVQFDRVNIDENPSSSVDILSSVSNPQNIDQSKFTLSNSILTLRYAIYQHKRNQATFDFSELTGKRVAVFKYGQLVEYLYNNHPDVNLFKINEIEEAFNEIELDNSTIYIGNEMVVDYEANLQGISYLKKVGYAPLETELRMAVRKDWPIMLSILNKSLVALEVERAEILDHWDMSIFKKNKIAIQVLLVIFTLFVISLLFKGYKLKLAMRKQEEAAQNLIWHQAHFDAQTDLPNRVYFEKLKKQSFDSALINHLKLGFLYIDLDGFKQVNDIHGHLLGDELIIQVANRLKKSIRQVDNIARLAGDEFVIILNNLNEVDIVDSIANRLLDSLGRPYLIQDTKINITASIGSSIFPDDTDNIETLIKYADTAMYEAKLVGKNTHKAFNQSMYDKIIKNQSTLIDLKKALSANEFRLYYQPIVNLKTKKIVKAEALIRWQHPQKGLIGPGEFISIAESANIITEIGDWVFKQAIADIKTLQKCISGTFSVSINVSPKQLQSSALIADWPSYLHKQHLNKNSLGLEITEGIALETNPAINHILHQLREAGARLLIDDFGTGYSSLSYLKKLNADYIKIDRSFVQNLSIYSEDMVLCETIILMAHKLGLQVIAEGIETQDQSNLLQSIGCDFGQGYLFSKPKPLAQLLTDFAAKSKNKRANTQTT